MRRLVLVVWILLTLATAANAQIKLSEEAKGIIAAGRKFPGAEVVKSEPSWVLMEAARRHAVYQARVCRQGHQYFDQRSNQLMEVLGNYRYAENAAESWPEQRDASYEELGHEFFKCWKQSSGHWRLASRRHRYFGVSMAQGGNGVWYACLIVAD